MIKPIHDKLQTKLTVDLSLSTDSTEVSSESAENAAAEQDLPVKEETPAQQEHESLVQTSRHFARANQSSDIFNAQEQPIAFRPSSRVLSRPGGASSNIFGTDEEAPVQKTGKRHLGSQASTIFEDETVPSSPNTRRDPNWSAHTAQDPPRTSHRLFAGKGNVSQISLSDSSEPTQQVHTGKRMSAANPNASHFSFSQDPAVPAPRQRRDPNARSEETAFRPSSRYF